MDQPCGKRMKDMLPIWVKYLKLSKETKEQLNLISAATIDRDLREFKVQAGKKNKDIQTLIWSEVTRQDQGEKLGNS